MAYDNSANLHYYSLFVFLPGPLHQFALFLSYSFLVSIGNNEGGDYMLFFGLSVPSKVPRCCASVLALLAGFLNSAGAYNPLYLLCV